MFRINREMSVDVKFAVSDNYERVVINGFGRSFTKDDFKSLPNPEAEKLRLEILGKIEAQCQPITTLARVAEEATKASELRWSEKTGNCFVTVTVSPVIKDDAGHVVADSPLVTEVVDELKSRLIRINVLDPLVNQAVSASDDDYAD